MNKSDKRIILPKTEKDKLRVTGRFASGTEFSITTTYDELRKMIDRGDYIISVNEHFWGRYE